MITRQVAWALKRNKKEQEGTRRNKVEQNEQDEQEGTRRNKEEQGGTRRNKEEQDNKTTEQQNNEYDQEQELYWNSIIEQKESPFEVNEISVKK